MLKVRFVEASREAARNLGVRWVQNEAVTWPASPEHRRAPASLT